MCHMHFGAICAINTIAKNCVNFFIFAYPGANVVCTPQPSTNIEWKTTTNSTNARGRKFRTFLCRFAHCAVRQTRKTVKEISHWIMKLTLDAVVFGSSLFSAVRKIRLALAECQNAPLPCTYTHVYNIEMQLSTHIHTQTWMLCIFIRLFVVAGRLMHVFRCVTPSQLEDEPNLKKAFGLIRRKKRREKSNRLKFVQISLFFPMPMLCQFDHWLRFLFFRLFVAYLDILLMEHYCLKQRQFVASPALFCPMGFYISDWLRRRWKRLKKG